MAKEKLFENQIKRYFHSIGIYPAGYPQNKMNVPITGWYIKYWAGAQFTKSGIPDILACVNGYFVGIEVKAQNGKPSEIQLHNVRKINAAGGFAFVLYPSKFGEFKKFIEGLTRDEFDRAEIPEIWK